MRGRKVNPPKHPNPPDKLRCPAWLDADAQKVFRTLAAELSGTVRQVDINLLAAYAQTFCRWRQAEAAVSQHGLIVETQWGPRQHPATRLADTYAKHLRLIGAELGLSPLARERMTIAERNPQADELHSFIEFRALDSA